MERRTLVRKGYIKPILDDRCLDLTLSLHFLRSMKKDGSFSFQRHPYGLKHLAEEKVAVAVVLGQELYVLKNDQKVAEFPL